MISETIYRSVITVNNVILPAKKKKIYIYCILISKLLYSNEKGH